MIKTDRFQEPDGRVTLRPRGQEPNPETESKMMNKGPLTLEVSLFQAHPRLWGTSQKEASGHPKLVHASGPTKHSDPLIVGPFPGIPATPGQFKGGRGGAVAIATEVVKGHSGLCLGGPGSRPELALMGVGMRGCKILFLLSHAAQNGARRKP